MCVSSDPVVQHVVNRATDRVGPSCTGSVRAHLSAHLELSGLTVQCLCIVAA